MKLLLIWSPQQSKKYKQKKVEEEGSNKHIIPTPDFGVVTAGMSTHLS